jgi:acetyl esterase
MTDPWVSAPLDPEVAEVKRHQTEAGLIDIVQTSPVSAMRAKVATARARFYPQIGCLVASIRDVTIPGPAGPLDARVVRPHSESAVLPTVVFFHGGGWVFGGLDSHEGHARRIADRAGAVVLSVAYRLAPEHPFPAAFDDAVAALRWAAANIDRLGNDPSALVVAGDSAGGNLALAAAIATVGDVHIRALLLFYPATDLTLTAHGAMERHYLGADHEQRARDVRASPALDERLGALPTIVIGVGGHDFLLEDNRAFVRRLERLRVDHRLLVSPTLMHGFASHASVSRACADATDALCFELRDVLSSPRLAAG